MYVSKKENICMRTTLNLPEELLRKAQKAVGARTRTEAIILGLQALLRRQKSEQLLSLEGKLPLQLDLHKSRERA
jgi:hypothetical protein